MCVPSTRNWKQWLSGEWWKKQPVGSGHSFDAQLLHDLHSQMRMKGCPVLLNRAVTTRERGETFFPIPIHFVLFPDWTGGVLARGDGSAAANAAAWLFTPPPLREGVLATVLLHATTLVPKAPKRIRTSAGARRLFEDPGTSPPRLKVNFTVIVAVPTLNYNNNNNNNFFFCVVVAVAVAVPRRHPNSVPRDSAPQLRLTVRDLSLTYNPALGP